MDITASGVSAVAVALFDQAGNLVADSRSAGSREFGEAKGYYLPERLSKRLSGRLEIQMYRGHRYRFVEEAPGSGLSPNQQLA